jgi:hypothetical protein
MAVDARCFAVILPPELKLWAATRSRNRLAKLKRDLYSMNAQ